MEGRGGEGRKGGKTGANGDPVGGSAVAATRGREGGREGGERSKLGHDCC